MRTPLTILLAAALAVGLTGAADAAPQKRSKHHPKPHAYGYRAPTPLYRYGYRAPAYPDRTHPYYQERLLDSAPFGSQRWWELYNESHEPW